jgi:hypothetical protein
MFSIQQTYDVKDGMVTVVLPPRFNAKRVNIIIFPVKEGADRKISEDLQDLLLTAPTLSDNELQEFKNIREWMNQWNIQDF